MRLTCRNVSVTIHPSLPILLQHVGRFDLVAVVDGGAIVEVGMPAELAARADSQLSRLMVAADDTKDP